MTDKNLEYTKTKNHWDSFKNWYWLIFGLVVLIRFLFSTSHESYSSEVILVIGVIDLVLKVSMVLVVGIYTYRITQKKRYLLVGLLGGLWTGLLLNLISFWVVKLLYHKKQAGLL